MFRGLNFEIRGRSHEANGSPCQDKTLVFEENGVCVAVLADGAGSAKHSDVGAACVCREMANLMCGNFDKFFACEKPADVSRPVVEKLREALEKEAKDVFFGVSENESVVLNAGESAGESVAVAEDANLQANLSPATQPAQPATPNLGDLASTLLCVAVKDGQFIICHLGDGIIVARKNGKVVVASDPSNGEFANTTCFVTSADAVQQFKLKKGLTEGIDAFGLMSDGSEVSFYERARGVLARKALEEIFSGFVAKKEAFFGELKAVFERNVREKTGDDCSLVLLVDGENFAACGDDFKDDGAKLESGEERLKRLDDIKKLTRQVGELKKQVGERDVTIRSLEEKVKRLERDVADKQKTIGERDTKIRSLESQKANLDTELKECKMLLEGLVKIQQERQAKRDAKQAEKDAKRAKKEEKKKKKEGERSLLDRILAFFTRKK